MANPTPPPGDDMEREVEGRGAGLDGRDVVAPLRTVGATVLGSAGDGRGGETALQGVGGWGPLGAAAGAGRQGWRGIVGGGGLEGGGWGFQGGGGGGLAATFHGPGA